MNTSYTRIFTGLGIILFGALLLLDTLNIAGFNNLLANWWPLFVIGAGVLVFLNDMKSYLWALLLIGFGVMYQLDVLNVINFNPWQMFWPAVIIVIGINIMFRHTGGRTNVATGDSDDVSAILGGADHVNKSEDYKGGKITTIMGGVKLDLRKSVIKKDATLDIFSLMGGVELWVPENVIVKSKAAVVLGGIENKSQGTEAKNTPVLYITGQVVMSGVEIKS